MYNNNNILKNKTYNLQNQEKRKKSSKKRVSFSLFEAETFEDIEKLRKMKEAQLNNFVHNKEKTNEMFNTMKQKQKLFDNNKNNNNNINKFKNKFNNPNFNFNNNEEILKKKKEDEENELKKLNELYQQQLRKELEEKIRK